MYAMRWKVLSAPRRQGVCANRHRPPAEWARRTRLDRAGRAAAPGRHVLLVAKDVAGRAALTAFLTEKGYHVTAAGSEEEALRCLARAPLPRLVLLDLDTAVRESLEVCRHRLQTDELRKVPLVAVSDGQCPPAPLALALGIAAHLGKPLCRDTLLETLERLCA